MYNSITYCHFRKLQFIIAKMLAARDQENLVHRHHAAAALKPLNNAIRQLQPKTPGNKIPKTPFKVPLNDENGGFGNGGGKTGLKLNGKGNENLMTGGKKGGLGDKSAFITPLGISDLQVDRHFALFSPEN